MGKLVTSRHTRWVWNWRLYDSQICTEFYIKHPKKHFYEKCLQDWGNANLAVANKQKARLTMRSIALLIETGDTAVMDLIEKICKAKPVKATA